jgi:hypothetical protein
MSLKRATFKTGEWASIAGISGFIDSLIVAYWEALLKPKMPWAPSLPPGIITAGLAGLWGFGKNISWSKR